MSKKLTIILSIAVILLCISPFAYRLYSMKPQKKYITTEITDNESSLGTAIEAVAKTAAKVKSDIAEGSGNIRSISPTYIDVVTAFHIIGNEGAAVSISFYDGVTVEGKVLRSSESKDIALVRVSRKDIKKAAKDLGLDGSMDYNSIRLHTEPIFSQDDIFIQDGREGTVSVGFVGSADEYIPDFDMNMIYCLCEVDPGMSGGGLFDSNGNYLGILLGGSEDGSVCLNSDQFEF